MMTCCVWFVVVVVCSGMRLVAQRWGIKSLLRNEVGGFE